MDKVSVISNHKSIAKIDPEQKSNPTPCMMVRLGLYVRLSKSHMDWLD